jgi:hypothetical protein
MNTTLLQLQRELADSLRGLDPAQTQLRPAANRWSIQQIAEHLLLTYSATETAIEARLVKRTPTRARPNLTQHIAQYTLIRIGYFPTGRKAPQLVTPPSTSQPLSGAQLIAAASDHLTRLDLLCNEAQEIFGPSTRCASHMILGPLSLDQWRRFQLIHGEHHIKQIQAVRKAHSV